MINWKDRKYINPRKRVFKNMDTDEILKLEIQDDPENIEEESETPLNAHNLNMAQQDLLEDMSKTYTGTNITAPTVEGYGTIHKLYGHTIEEGSGEKSPSNPYTLRCVGDDVNLFNKNLHIELDGKYRHASNGQQINNTSVYGLKIPVNPNTDYILNADITNDNVTNLCFFNSEMTYLSGNNFTGNDKIFQTPNSCKYITVAISKNFTKLKLQQGLVATPYSPYNQGTLEIISQNGDQQSSNIVVTKPLCCLKDGDNIVAQDWIDYDKGVVHRECGYLRLHEIEPSYSTIRGDYFIAQFNVSNYKLKSVVLCNFLQYIDGGNWDIEKESVSYGGSTGNSIQVKVLKSRLVTVDSAGLLSFLGSVNATVVYQLTTLLEEPLDCSNKIVQYADETTVSNRDGAEIEVSLTNNKAISEVNGELGSLQEKQIQMRKYSTEEQVVGTWIDGKPLYRKVFKVTSDERLAFEDILSQNIDMAILCGGYVKGGGGSKNSIELGGFYRISVNIGGTTKFVSTAEGNTKIVEYSLIVIYTKTTD